MAHDLGILIICLCATFIPITLLSLITDILDWRYHKRHSIPMPGEMVPMSMDDFDRIRRIDKAFIAAISKPIGKEKFNG